jgi:hypothetical protein
MPYNPRRTVVSEMAIVVIRRSPSVCDAVIAPKA